MNDRGGSRWERPPDSNEPIEGNIRTIQFKVWDGGITFFSAGRTNDHFNVFYFTLKVDNGVFMHFNYIRGPSSDQAERFHENVTQNRKFPENGFPPPPTGSDWKDAYSFRDLGFSIFMNKLREFNETDNDISSYLFRDMEFSRPTVSPIIEDDKTIGVEIATFTKNNVFGLTFYIVSTARYGEQKGITPFEVKYDISINNYPFRAEDSYLALENVFALPEDIPRDPTQRKFGDSPMIPGRESPKNERTIGYDLESASMFFSWTTNVTVDGEEHNVTAEYSGTVSGEQRMIERMTFIYPQGVSIFHDPKIGVADLLDYADDAREFLELLISWSTGLGIGVVLVALVAVRMKPSKFDWED